MSHAYSVKQSEEICKTLNALRLGIFLSDVYLEHVNDTIVSTHTELTAQEILNIYAKRWNIEVFFRSCKQKLAFDKCQLRKKQGITRMWLILSLVHFLCCTVSGCVGSFDEGYNDFRNCILQEIFAQNALSM